VEPTEDARPEVQATAIELRVPLPGNESQCNKIEFFTFEELGLFSVGRAPPPAAFEVVFALDLLAVQLMSLFAHKIKVKGGGRGRPPYTVRCSLPLDPDIMRPR
jgi:hypothetical protein